MLGCPGSQRFLLIAHAVSGLTTDSPPQKGMFKPARIWQGSRRIPAESVQVSKVNSTSSLCKIFLIGRWLGSELETHKKLTSCNGYELCHGPFRSRTCQNMSQWREGFWKPVWNLQDAENFMAASGGIILRIVVNVVSSSAPFLWPHGWTMGDGY